MWLGNRIWFLKNELELSYEPFLLCIGGWSYNSVCFLLSTGKGGFFTKMVVLKREEEKEESSKRNLEGRNSGKFSPPAQAIPCVVRGVGRREQATGGRGVRYFDGDGFATCLRW